MSLRCLGKAIGMTIALPVVVAVFILSGVGMIKLSVALFGVEWVFVSLAFFGGFVTHFYLSCKEDCKRKDRS